MNNNNFYIELDSNSTGAVIGRIYYRGSEIFSASHLGLLSVALFSLGVQGTIYHDGAFIEQAAEKFDADGSTCLMPLTLEPQRMKFVANLIFLIKRRLKTGALLDKEKVESHFHAVVHYLPCELVVNRPSTPTPPDFKRILKECNSHIYFPSH